MLSIPIGLVHCKCSRSLQANSYVELRTYEAYLAYFRNVLKTRFYVVFVICIETVDDLSVSPFDSESLCNGPAFMVSRILKTMQSKCTWAYHDDEEIKNDMLFIIIYTRRMAVIFAWLCVYETQFGSG